jgi:alkane 1-monooxygenase
LAMFPPLWRRVMDPRVLDFYRGDIRLAALKPVTAHRRATLRVHPEQCSTRIT